MLFFTDLPAAVATPAAPPIPLSSPGVCRDERGRVLLKCLPPGVVVKLDRPTVTPTATPPARLRLRPRPTRKPR